MADAGEHGIERCMVPYENRQEAMIIKRVKIIAVKNLQDVITYLNGDTGDGPDKIACADSIETKMIQQNDCEADTKDNMPDFSQINGMRFVRRASEIAAACMHNFLMIGPPGAGKTMAARRIPTILPPMCEEEQLEIAKIYSVSGMLLQGKRLLRERPFRSPHHTITPQGLAGGGAVPKPGEISLAHKGVLFLDELAEFQKTTLELLRQPMEEKEIHLSRLQGSYTYPADFMLVAAMNPCPCGAYPDMNRCRCSQSAIDRYLGRISQPLLDRIDICVETGQLTYEELTAKTENESSFQIRQRVCQAWQLHVKQTSYPILIFLLTYRVMIMENLCLRLWICLKTNLILSTVIMLRA